MSKNSKHYVRFVTKDEENAKNNVRKWFFNVRDLYVGERISALQQPRTQIKRFEIKI